MDSTRAALLCVIAILAIGLCVTSYMAFGEKATPSDDGDDPIETPTIVDTWEWKVGYKVTSTNMEKVDTLTSGDDITITNQYGKLLYMTEGDLVRLCAMTNQYTAICLTMDGDLEADNYFYTPSENLMLKYYIGWGYTDDTTFAGVNVYVRQGTTVSDAEIDGYLTCPDICKSYEQKSVSTNSDSLDIVSKTTTIHDLEHGLIYVTETINFKSGDTRDVRCVGFVTPTNKNGETWGIFSQNPADVPDEMIVPIEFSSGADYFCTLFTNHMDEGSFSAYFSNEDDVDVPNLEGLTLVCSGGSTTLTKDSVERDFTKDFRINITKQDGCVFSGYAEQAGEKLFDITGLISTGTGDNFLIEYECINTRGTTSYYVYIGNLDDGFDGAGGDSYGIGPKVISSKLIVDKKN